MTNDLILRIVARLLIPFILLFALYVQFHGDFGPGGGFQAGVIFAAGIIFHALIFGLSDARRVIPDRLIETMMAIGVLLYAGIGVGGMILGGISSTTSYWMPTASMDSIGVFSGWSWASP